MQAGGHCCGFQAADVAFAIADLALQIAPFHGVVIGNQQTADAGGGQIGQGGGTQTAAADYQRGGIKQALLAADVDFVEQDVAAVAQKFLVVHGGFA